jgi:hypothetical protein
MSESYADLPDILCDIKHAEESPTFSQKKNAWSTYIDYFERGSNEAHDPEFNLPYVFGSSLIPNLVFQNPHILAVPTSNKPEAVRQSMLWEGIDNFLVDLMGVRDEVEKAVTYAFCTNMGILELGWDSVSSEPLKTEPEGSQFPRINPTDSRRRKNFPWIRALDPRDVIIPSGFTHIRHVPWYAKKVCLPKYEVEKIPELKGKTIEYNYESKSEVLGNTEKDKVDYLTFYIHRSVATGKVTWVTTEGTILYEADDPLQVGGLPLVIFNFNPAINDIYGTPDVAYIESQYLEGNELRADGRWQRKNATLKVFYNTNLVTEKDMKRFLDGEPLPAIGLDVPTNGSLRDAVLEVQPNVQREYLEYADFLIKDTEYLLGFGPNQMGTVSRGRRTAFEMQQVAQNSMLRLSKRRESVGTAISQAFTIINALCERNWKTKQVLPILGPELSFYYAEITEADLKGRSQITTKVSAESLAPTSVEKRRADMLEVMSVLGQFSPDSAQMLRPLIQKFISSFDWGELKSVLPQQEGNPSLQDVPTQGMPDQNTLQALNMLNPPQGPQLQPGEENAQQAPQYQL